jgi:hypothetical protein
MKPSKQDSEYPAKANKSTFGDLLEKGPKKNETTPSEEFISPDPSRSKPEKDTEPEEIDKMGISKKAKNQPSD